MLRIESLTKSYGKLLAVDGISFKVKEGELFAFLGLNGAGKSTTISIICGQLEKDSGNVFVGGYDIDKSTDDVKKLIGVVFQNSVIDKTLTVYDNLECKAAMYGIVGDAFKSKLAELADLLDLNDLLYCTVEKLSGGQKRRIDIARALLHSPKLLILDEPTTGLDPQTRKMVWSAIEKLRNEQGVTVFLTTHYMEEAVDADYVVILDSGRISAEGTPLQLKNRYVEDYITIYGGDREAIKKLGYKTDTVRDGLRISVPDTATATRLIVNNPELFTDYEITKGKMDDVFLAVTGKQLAGGDKQ